MAIVRRKTECERAWRGGADFRIVCDCQRHSRRGGRGLLGRSFSLASRGAAVLVSIPLALAAFDLPGEATERHLRVLTSTSVEPQLAAVTAPPRGVTADEDGPRLRIFTTRAIAEGFLRPRHSRRNLTLEVFRREYFERQVPFGAIIYREALKNDLPPELVAAMVHTESDFRPRLVSGKSAQGLMQIVPDTARLLGVTNPFDPEENIAAGTRYFRYLLGRFENETIALAAYNAGEGNVVRFGGIPPFDETRSYISKVHRRTSHYRQGLRSSYLATVRMQSETD